MILRCGTCWNERGLLLLPLQRYSNLWPEQLGTNIITIKDFRQPFQMSSDSSNDSELMQWLPQLLQTNDSLFPSGSFAHSFGLEGWVQLEQANDQATLKRFLRDQLVPALTHFELPFLRLAYQATHDHDLPRLIALDERYGAMKGSFEFRQASARIGAQRLEMLHKLWPNPLLDKLQQEFAAGNFQAHATIICGVQTALAEIPLEAGLLAFYYQALATLISAALKLIRIGQTAGQLLLTEHLENATGVIARSTEVDESEVGWFQPALDIASMRHETAYSRIFIS